MDNALVLTEHAAIDVDDVSRFRRAGLQALDNIRVMPLRHEADVLAVALVGDGEAESARMLTHLRLREIAERKAQQVELLARRSEQEVALVALLVARAEKASAAGRQRTRGNVMPGREHVRAELARGVQQVVEFDRHIAVDAGHWRFALDIALREAIDHRLLEAALVV